jgi:hypothetical protein
VSESYLLSQTSECSSLSSFESIRFLHPLCFHRFLFQSNPMTLDDSPWAKFLWFFSLSNSIKSTLILFSFHFRWFFSHFTALTLAICARLGIVPIAQIWFQSKQLCLPKDNKITETSGFVKRLTSSRMRTDGLSMKTFSLFQCQRTGNSDGSQGSEHSRNHSRARTIGFCRNSRLEREPGWEFDRVPVRIHQMVSVICCDAWYALQ